MTCYNDTVDDNIEGNFKGERLVCGLKGKAFSKLNFGNVRQT